MGLFGSSPEDYYTGADWQKEYGDKVVYNPTAYRAFNPSTFGGGMGANYQNTVNQQLSGQLSPAQLQQLNQQFSQNLASIRESGFGVPSGAERGLEYQSGIQNALNAALLGQSQIAQGQSAAMPYLQMGQNESQFGNTLANNQSQFGANLGLQKAQFMGGLNQQAQQNSAQDQGIFGGLLGAATNFGLGKLFGGGGQQESPYSIDMSPYGNTNPYEQEGPTNWNIFPNYFK